MMTPKEFDMKGTVTIGFIVYIAVISFALGGVVTRVLSQGDEIVKAREYTEQEVGGLRSDWERRNAEVERRLLILEKYHLEK